MTAQRPAFSLHIGWVPGHVHFEPNTERVSTQKPNLPHRTTNRRIPESQRYDCTPPLPPERRCYKSSLPGLHHLTLGHCTFLGETPASPSNSILGVSARLYKMQRALPDMRTARKRAPFFFLLCPLRPHRALLRAALGRKATSLGYLLTEEKGMHHLLRYIHATKVRLPAYHDIAPPKPTT
ncbi:hypothetical protein DFH07DRAFT_810517 [Mycena maculata]|uniref:Uncharacterized protein n=1 Tax=Mycena maculata TaxID=230809 RepID=A0AAD7JLL5_9AGAR|nr:hypothetical protein DFH07DRAFT_810517 [Mycena maculata]